MVFVLNNTLKVLSVFVLFSAQAASEEAGKKEWLTFHELDGKVEFRLPAFPKKSLTFHGGSAEAVSRDYVCSDPDDANTIYSVLVEPLADNRPGADKLDEQFDAILGKLGRVPGVSIDRHQINGKGNERSLTIDAKVEQPGLGVRECRVHHHIVDNFAVSITTLAPKGRIESNDTAKRLADSFQKAAPKGGDDKPALNLSESVLHWAALDAVTIRYYAVLNNAMELDRGILVDFLEINGHLSKHRTKTIDELKRLKSVPKHELDAAFKMLDPGSERKLIEATASIVKLFNQQDPLLLPQLGSQIGEMGSSRKSFAAEMTRLIDGVQSTQQDRE